MRQMTDRQTDKEPRLRKCHYETQGTSERREQAHIGAQGFAPNGFNAKLLVRGRRSTLKLTKFQQLVKKFSIETCTEFG